MDTGASSADSNASKLRQAARRAQADVGAGMDEGWQDTAGL